MGELAGDHPAPIAAGDSEGSARRWSPDRPRQAVDGPHPRPRSRRSSEKATPRSTSDSSNGRTPCSIERDGHGRRLPAVDRADRRRRRGGVARLPGAESARNGSAPARSGSAGSPRPRPGCMNRPTTSSPTSPSTCTRKSAPSTSPSPAAACAASPAMPSARPLRRSCRAVPTCWRRRPRTAGPLRVEQVPEGYLPIASATGGAASRQLLIAPAMAEGVVEAVLELGFLGVGRIGRRGTARTRRRAARAGDPHRQGQAARPGAARGNAAAGRGAADPAGRAARRQRGTRGAGAGAQGVAGDPRIAAGRAGADQPAALGAGRDARTPERGAHRRADRSSAPVPASSSAPTRSRASFSPT